MDDVEAGGTVVTRRPHPLTWALVGVVVAVVAVLGGFLLFGEDGGGEAADEADGGELSARERVEIQFGDADLLVFMQPDALPDQIEELRLELVEIEDIVGITYLDQEASLAEARTVFPDNPDLEDAEVDQINSRFKIELTDGADGYLLGEDLRFNAGVDGVVPRPDDAVLDQADELREGSNSGDLFGGATAAVFFDPNSSPSQHQVVEEELEDSGLDVDIDFVDQTDALERFSMLFADDPLLLSSVTARILPPSFDLTAHPDDAEVVVELACGLAAMPGVREVAVAEPYEC